MRARLLKKIRKNRYIEFNKKTKMYRYRHGEHMVDGSTEVRHYIDTGWTRDLSLVRFSMRESIIQDARIYFACALFTYKRPYIELIK